MDDAAAAAVTGDEPPSQQRDGLIQNQATDIRLLAWILDSTAGAYSF